MEDFMIDVIPYDFDVKILSNQEDACLFYGFKKGYVHFVKYYGQYIVQQHIPRFEFARCFEILLRTEIDNPAMPVADKFNTRLMAAKYSQEDYSIFFGKHMFPLKLSESIEFFKDIQKDVKKYKAAMKSVKREGDKFFIDTIVSAYGSELFTDDGNSDILTAIAFENKIFKNLTASPPVSIYALYSMLLEKKYVFTSAEFGAMAEKHFSIVPEELGEDLKNIYDKVQSNYFSDLSADTGKEYTTIEKTKKIKKAYSSLKPYQKSQFAELFDVHGVPFFLIFAFVSDIIDVFEYFDIISRGYQPDSDQEQSIRYESSVIASFGKLFQNN